MDKSILPVVLGLAPTFGFGDRLGLATPGHLSCVKSHGGPIKPIFAQQSIREMVRTERTPIQVIDSAVHTLKHYHYAGPWGADADHLKTPADVDYTASAHFVFFTIDPSDYVDPHADGYDASTLKHKFDEIKSDTPWVKHYQGKTVQIPEGPAIKLDEVTVHRAAVKYGRAITHAIHIASHIEHVASLSSHDYEIELSVDETPHPTTLAEHYIIADQFAQAKIKLTSLAPRFIGEFEKGVDYKGDLVAFEKSLADHAAIARHLGPYKLSLHSGSDKLSIYSIFARVTRGMFHVKTAGTSYLEALRVIARHDHKLFRHVIDFARSHYQTDRATYHVSATLADAPASKDVANIADLESAYLENWSDVPAGKGFTKPGRQILHCTFGSVLTDPNLGAAVRGVLRLHPDAYKAFLVEHFGRHLDALNAGMKS